MDGVLRVPENIRPRCAPKLEGELHPQACDLAGARKSVAISTCIDCIGFYNMTDMKSEAKLCYQMQTKTYSLFSFARKPTLLAGATEAY